LLLQFLKAFSTSEVQPVSLKRRAKELRGFAQPGIAAQTKLLLFEISREGMTG
jgi:hypothetical protein